MRRSPKPEHPASELPTVIMRPTEVLVVLARAAANAKRDRAASAITDDDDGPTVVDDDAPSDAAAKDYDDSPTHVSEVVENPMPVSAVVPAVAEPETTPASCVRPRFAPSSPRSPSSECRAGVRRRWRCRHCSLSRTGRRSGLATEPITPDEADAPTRPIESHRPRIDRHPLTSVMSLDQAHELSVGLAARERTRGRSRRCSAEDPNNPELWYLAGRIEHARGEHLAALQLVRAAADQGVAEAVQFLPMVEATAAYAAQFRVLETDHFSIHYLN